MKGTLMENSFDKWFWDENLSHLNIGDKTYLTKKRHGNKIRLYGIIKSIDIQDAKVLVTVEKL